MNHSDEKIPLAIGTKSKAYLATIAKYTRIISVVFLILIGVVIVCNVFMLITNSFNVSRYMAFAIPAGIISVLFFAVFGVLFYCYYCLYASSGILRRALQDEDGLLLEEAFLMIRRYWKIQGILMICTISLAVLNVIMVRVMISQLF